MRLLSLTSLAVLCAVGAACEPVCTEIGCDGAFQVVVAGADGERLPPSTYEVALDVDGEPASFLCGEGPDGEWFCEEPEGAPSFNIYASADGNRGEFSFGINKIEGMDQLGPARIQVNIIAGDAPLADEVFEPEYEANEINGEGCGVCENAEPETISIDVEMG